MSNTLNSNGSFQFNINNQLIPLTLIVNTITLTGSNMVYDARNVPLGATPTGLLSSSLQTVRYTYFSNVSPSGSTIYVYPTTAATNAVCVLSAGDVALIPNTGSVTQVTYYAYASGSSDTALLAYAMCEL